MDNVKKLLLILLVLPLWTGCYKSLLPKTDEFTHTGCATDAGNGTRSGLGQSDVSLLILKYEDGNLRVTRTNATMNCAIKLNGIACDVTESPAMFLSRGMSSTTEFMKKMARPQTACAGWKRCPRSSPA